MHEVLSRFAGRYPHGCRRTSASKLFRIAAEGLRELSAHPRVAAFWLPRLARFAEWFAQTEADRRAGVTRLVAEVAGAQVLDAPGGPFTLRARADRIDVAARGVIITDYKTGALPSDTAVVSGYAPQLPLEAAIAAAGGFAHFDARWSRRCATSAPPAPSRPEPSVLVRTGDVTALAGKVARRPASPDRALRRRSHALSGRPPFPLQLRL